MSVSLIQCPKSYLVKNTNHEVEEGDRDNNTEQTNETKKRAATAPINEEEWTTCKKKKTK